MIFCSNCGKANEEAANFCPNCGSALQKTAQDNLNETYQQQQVTDSEANRYDHSSPYSGQPAVSGGIKALLYIVTIFFSLAGIIIGIIYMSDPLEEKRVFGKKLLIFGIIWTILVFVIPIIAFVVFALPFGHHYMYY